MTDPKPLHFWIDGTHWTLCEIISQAFGVCVVRLYNEVKTRKGKVRKGYVKNTWLVTEAK